MIFEIPRSLKNIATVSNRFRNRQTKNAKRFFRMQTRICRLIERHDIRIEKMELKSPDDNDVVIQMGAGGICGSDLHYYKDGGFGTIKVREPIILGHEVSGTIQALGPKVKNLKKGDKVSSGNNVKIATGNTLPLNNIPVGTIIHCIEMKPGKGAQIARSAGASVQVLAKEGNYATLRLKSGEVRKVLISCKATVGEVGHQEHNLRKLGKAGASRWRGVRPTVRGVVMNPVDHPHGGGEGKTSGGRHPVSPWGVPTKGYKTRSNKVTDKFIVRRRKKRK